LSAETGAATGPVTFQGFLAATTGSAAATIDASVSALQTIALTGGMSLVITIPAESNSVANISVDSNANCPATAPTETNCAQYTLIEPGSNPSVGIFSSGKITYAAPASGNVLYSVGANAFIPMSGGATDCTPPSQTISVDATPTRFRHKISNVYAGSSDVLYQLFLFCSCDQSALTLTSSRSSASWRVFTHGE
jgi:hypothetical protein